MVLNESHVQALQASFVNSLDTISINYDKIQNQSLHALQCAAISKVKLFMHYNKQDLNELPLIRIVQG